MFVPVMEGKVKAVEAMRREMDRWVRELHPGATRFLGSTAGVTADGRAINLARFESAAAAQANSSRPEQGEWWGAMEKCYEGELRADFEALLAATEFFDLPDPWLV